jgi:hypothetical protein
MWTIRATDEFAAWFRGLTGAEREAVDVKVGLLKLMGPKLGRPHADTLSGSKYANMKELRADTADAVLRVAFAFDPNREAILLTGGNKTGVNQRRFYKQLISTADEIYRRHLTAIVAAKKKGK